MTRKKIFRSVALVALTLSASACVEREVEYRDRPPQPVQRLAVHPAYLRALSDLRFARSMIEQRQGDGIGERAEQTAVDEIDHAIHAIRHAAIDDGKDVNYLPPPDAPSDHRGRLHAALDSLNRVQSYLSRDEDNVYAQGLRDRALRHVDAAAQATADAIHALRRANDR